MSTRPPSVDALARSIDDVDLPHPLLVDAAREAIAAGAPESAADRAARTAQLLLQRVVNATGVLLHTNLGRAPAVVAAHGGALNLELDLSTGRRGSRQAAVGRLAARATDAERALVVNNGAAAVMLVLAAIAGDGGRVVVSRGELVEIGGGFRIPEVLAGSGARLVEVGTTNRTRLTDYVRAVDDAEAAGDPVRAILKVHPSNYRIVGFTESVSVSALSELGVPVVADIGSGLLDERCPWLDGGPPSWLEGEPGASQTLAAGAAVVTFSGDKLLGGPQAGIVAGTATLVERCARQPLARALRPGAQVLVALQATLRAHLGRDVSGIEFWRQATVSLDELRLRADALVAGAAGATVVDTAAVPGAGSAPGRTLPSIGVALEGDHTSALRSRPLPIVARVEDGRTICDLRTVHPDDDAEVGAALASVRP